MLDGFTKFKEFFDKKLIKMRYRRLDALIQKFNFLQILKDEKFDQIIIQKINESKAIAIDRYYNGDEEIIIVCFESHLIIIDRSQQYIIKTLLSRNNEDMLYFVPKSNSRQNSFFEEEIGSFTNFLQIYDNGLKTINYFWRIIVPCLSAYLIKKSYVKTYKDRVKNYNTKTIEIKKFEEDEFIPLRTVGASNSSTVYLKYHIESEELFSIKSFHQKNDKLIIREMINYKNLNYPFLSKIYGEINTKNEDSLVIEFINGQTLRDFHKKKLNLKQKILIIIEILYSVQYLHRNDFIYRDLKPNNLIIDQNQRIVLFDFDRMIQKDEIAFTKDFNSNFADPEMN